MNEAAWSGSTGEVTDSNASVHGTAMNGASIGAGLTAACGVFSGSSYLGFGNQLDLPTAASQITVSAWIKQNASNTGLRPIVSKMQSAGAFSGWMLTTNQGNGVGGGSRLFVIIRSNTSSAIQIATNAGLVTPDVWHHLAFSYDGSSVASGVKFYIDGVEITNLTTSQDTLANASPSTPAPFNIGGRNNGANTFSGRIDDVAIWNRALTAAELKAVTDAGPDAI